MPGSTEPRSWLAPLLLLLCALPARAQFGAGPLLEGVDSSESGRNVTVFVQLRCTARYLAHTPADTGSSVSVRMKLGPDCGPDRQGPDEASSSGGASALIKGVRLAYTLPGEIEVVISWQGEHHFVMTPTTDARGIRLRLLDVFPAPRAAVTTVPLDGPTSGYAVNLLSTTDEIPASQVDTAAALLKTPVHVSSVELAGQTWHRLRAGPVSSRRDAERLLAVARANYPRAWLGVNDEAAAAEVIVPPATELAPVTLVDPALPDAERSQLMNEGRRAVAKKDWPRAVEYFTRLTRQPEYPDRARAQELLALTRERAGQLAHAKAEYEEYLRRYPKGEAATRVRARLRTLVSASRSARGGLFAGADGDAEHAWRVDGGVALRYDWQRSDLTTAATDETRQEQNAAYTDVDLVARRRGERFDFVSRLSAGYAHDLLDNGPGDQVRVSSAFIEINDRELGVATRLGRQSRNSGGLLGTFDGAYSSWQWRERIAFSAAAGFPVESTRESTDSGRRFFGVAADFGPFAEKLDLGAFAVMQQLDGLTDRQAVGVEARYFVPGRTLLAMVDYDIHYQELNSAVLTGSLQLPARWTVSFSADHRRAPVLTTRNALIGQPFATLDELRTLFSPDEVEMLARDRTALSDLYSLSVSRPLGERFQFSLDVYANRIGETVASGNVAATPDTGLERTAQLQLTASNLARANDLWLVALRQQDGALVHIDSLLLATRLPLGASWRLGPRLRVDRRSFTVDASDETLLAPSLRIDYLRGRSWFECEAGAESGARQLDGEQEDNRRYFLSVAWRINF